MFGAGNRRDRISLIRIRIHPAASLIFHVVSRFFGDIAAVVTLYHPQREIDARRKSARGRKISVFHKARAALQIDLRKVHCERPERAVVSGC